MRRIVIILLGIFSTAILSVYALNPSASGFAIRTTSFSNQENLPMDYTCEGSDKSPVFDWSHIPANTKSLVLIMSDLDGPTGPFYHWIIYNIPKNVTSLPEGATLPAGSMIGKNSFGKTQYNGPCPPRGALHRYVFTLYALDDKLMLPAGADGKTVLNEMQNHILDQVDLLTLYRRIK